MKEFHVNKIEKIRLLGRNGKTPDGAAVLFWGASAIEVNVQARELWAHISADYEGLEIYVSIEVNGFQIQRFIAPKESSWICLCKNLNPQNENLISIIKDTQPMPGDKKHILKIDAFKLDDNGEFCDLKPRSLKLEFIGDSITSGEGLAGQPFEMDWISQWFCSSKTYAVQTARLLDANWNCISQSGWGICWGWDGNTETRIPKFYKSVCGLLNGTEQCAAGSCNDYDFAGGSDFVILNLGTNDDVGFSFHDDGNGQNGKAGEAIIFEVSRFLAEIRKCNPHAKIIWCWGMVELNIVPVLIQKGVELYKTQSGDKDIYTLEFESMNCIEKSNCEKGSREHPGLKTHKLAAEKLAAFIKNQCL